MNQPQFSYQRSRGIVWVCDLAESSKHLNDNATAAEIEVFLPRLHWLGMVAVEAAGGTFIKWTGDGFLAWFETPLHRELAQKARSLFEAIWYLTFTVNVTQLGTSPSKKFHLRHGVAYEHDALLTTIIYSSGHKSLDITGRAVVLAFRLSGIPAAFPNLVMDSTLAKAAKDEGFGLIHVKSWVPKPEDLLRYFKGERWGTRGLGISGSHKSRTKTLQSIVKKAEKLLSNLDNVDVATLPTDTFLYQYVYVMYHGPRWAKKALIKEARIIKDDYFGFLKAIIRLHSKKPSPTKEEAEN